MRNRARMLLCLLVCAACSSPKPPETFRFPAGMLWGTATAGFQVDMGCPTLSAAACEDTGSDWYVFVTDPTTVNDPEAYLSGDAPSLGPGFWELYEDDLDRAADELGNNTFRFSFEWSRIFPTATDGVTGHANLLAIADPVAVAHYHDMIAAMRARGLEPMATVNHYTLPTWLHDAVGCHQDLATCSPKGWVDATRTTTEIAKLAGFLAEEYGDEVDWWITLNEPFAVALSGYLLPNEDRTNPPAVSAAAPEALTVLLAMIEAHARMYDAIHAADTVDADGDGTAAWVGNAHAAIVTAPADPSDPLDQQAAENVFYLWNSVFLNATILGDLDDDLDGVAEHRDDLAGRMDFVGVNYYDRVVLEGIAAPVLPDLSPLTTFNPFTMVLDTDYPAGIYGFAMQMQSAYGLPVIVTENGRDDPGDGDAGPRYIVSNLAWLARAAHDGVDVRGYYYWSLVDNYEWNHGFNLRFGLYALDTTDPAKPRAARPGVATYAQIVGANEVTRDLIDALGAP